MKKMTVIQAWQALFEKYKIKENVDEKGYIVIKADEIAEFKEPRVMTKFDEQSQLPKMFRENGLSIVSNSRNSYIIGRFAIFSTVDYRNLIRMNLDSIEFETLSINDLYSESSSIMYAFNSNIFKETFNTEDMFFTAYGRMGAGEFSFKINVLDSRGKLTGKSLTINVDRPQIEIDGAFETEDAFYIVEAKNRYVEDINLRQLYYPFRLWSEKINKSVVPVFLVYSDKTFYVYVCNFEDPNNINSIKIQKALKFSLADEPITMPEVVKILRENTPEISQYSTIFPQADKMERVIDLLNILNDRPDITKNELASYFQIEPRQVDYYLNAAVFIGFAYVNKRKSFGVTERCKISMAKTVRERNLDLIRAIFKDVVYHLSFDYLLENGVMPPTTFIADLIRKYYPPQKEGSRTPHRRAQTVQGWINWINELIDNDQ